NQGPVVRGQSPVGVGAAATTGKMASLPGGSSAGVAGPNPVMPSASSMPAHIATTASVAPALSPEQAMARAQLATVRIRVDEGNTVAHGTGTVIDVHGSEALVLTCGHLFRDMKPGTILSVDLFAGTPQEVSIASQLVDFRAEEEDIGLIVFKLPVAVEPVSLLPKGQTPEIGQPVFSFGCDHGATPSRRDTRVTNVNRYLGASNIEISGAPAVGRSGGGLFDMQGRLVGVCNAANANENEGIYASADVIYDQIQRLGLSHLFLKDEAAGGQQLALSVSGGTQPGQLGMSTDIASSPAGLGQPATLNPLSQPASNPALLAGSVSVPAAMSNPSLPISGAGQQAAELTVIVRNADGSERVLRVAAPSQTLMQSIQAESK
ncbi:MAG: serine protease, partial [Planctomycetota bacterium]